MTSSDRPHCYLHAWMMARCWSLLAEIRKHGKIPDGPISIYATDDKFLVTFTIMLKSSSSSMELAATGAEILAMRHSSSSPLTHLTTLEQAVFAICTKEPQTTKAIARKCQRSLNRVREAIASLVAKGLLERTANWCVRLAAHKPS